MPASHRINTGLHIGSLECVAPSNLEDLEHALSGLFGEPEFSALYGVLLELGAGTALLAPTRALGVAELLANRCERLRPLAVCVASSAEYSTGRLIAMLGRHRGLSMEAFPNRRAAVQWLAERTTLVITSS